MQWHEASMMTNAWFSSLCLLFLRSYHVMWIKKESTTTTNLIFQLSFKSLALFKTPGKSNPGTYLRDRRISLALRQNSWLHLHIHWTCITDMFMWNMNFFLLLHKILYIFVRILLLFTTIKLKKIYLQVFWSFVKNRQFNNFNRPCSIWLEQQVQEVTDFPL